jgi:hypothetical protein
VCSCILVCVLLRTRHPQVWLLRQLHGCVRMRLRALGRSEVQRQRSAGSAACGRTRRRSSRRCGFGTRVSGVQQCARAGLEVFGRGACLSRVVRRSRSGLGTTLWLCSCKRKARRKREAKAKPAQAQICGSPRLGLVCRKGRCRRDDGRWSWWWRRVCLFLNNGLSMYSVGTTVDVDAALCWWRERGGAFSQRAESLAVTYPCLDSRSNFQLNARRPVRTFLLPSCLHSVAKNTSIHRHAHHTQTIKLTLGKDTCITRSDR